MKVKDITHVTTVYAQQKFKVIMHEKKLILTFDREIGWTTGDPDTDASINWVKLLNEMGEREVVSINFANNMMRIYTRGVTA